MALSFSVLFGGCNDEPSFIGMEVFPKGEIFEAGIYEDTLEIFNTFRNRIRSDGPTESSYGIIGHFNNSNIGTSKADFVTEVSIPEGLDIFNLNNSYKPDSLVLCLAYSNNSWYGDTLKELNFKIYGLTERLSPTGKYYSDHAIDISSSQLLAERRVSPKDGIPDSIWRTSNYEHQLRFNLNLDNNRLRDSIFNLNSEDLKNRDTFKEKFYGFYVTCDEVTGNGVLIGINLRSTKSSMVLYYQRELIDYEDPSIVYGYERDTCNFPINRESRMFNRFGHEWADGITFDDKECKHIYLQGMAGSFAGLDISNTINAWRDSIAANNGFDYSFSGITLEFQSDTVEKTSPLLYLERQPYIAIYEEQEMGNFAVPKYKNTANNESIIFYEIITSNNGSSVNSYSTYSSATNKFMFRMNPKYFDQLVRNSEMEIKPFYLRALTPEFSFKQTVLLNKFRETIGGTVVEAPPKITVKYVKYIP